MGDPNKHKYIISISNCISSLYECMKILISVKLYAYYNVYAYYLCFPLSVKLSKGFQSGLVHKKETVIFCILLGQHTSRGSSL